ncbi:MAG: subclass B3 metallo-beta-lactamase [Alphaproteobacteria bacterium]|nr:MAG: subclass B3 metallo-beta-lactamase [Alphaproteobacteria bacterium]
MKSMIGAGFAFAAVTMGTPAFAQANWNKPTEPFHIAGNIYYVGTEGLGAYLFTGPKGHVLLDGATPQGAPVIEANIAKLGFKLSDVKILLNSHAHFDHSGGLAQLKKDTGATLAVMEGDVSAVEGGFYLGSESNKAMGAPPVKVDRVLKDGDKVTLEGIELTANLTPGHSKGCTSWGAKTTEAGKTYDVLVFCSATVAANRITPPLQYEGIVEDYRATFKKVKAMKADIPLAPHPEFFDMLEKNEKAKAAKSQAAFVDPGALGELIAKLEADFEKTLKERTAKAQ